MNLPAKMFRFCFALSVFCLLLFLLSPRPTFAQTNNHLSPVPSSAIATSQGSSTYTQAVLFNVMVALTCNLAGIDPTGPDPITGQPKKCLSYNQQTGALGYVQGNGGAIGIMGGLIGMLYNNPVSSTDYVRYLARNFGISKPAYAAIPGQSGFDGLTPLLPVWTVFRNLVYVLFALAFVLVGLAIMLRIKIDPRTVMTIQNQIPKLIIALVLVTFSYAIAGLLVDLMYVAIYLVFGIALSILPDNGEIIGVQGSIQGDQPISFVNNLFNNIHNLGGAGGILSIALGAGGGIQHTISSLFAPKNALELLLLPNATAANCNGFLDVGCWVGHVFTGTIGTVLSQIFGWIASWIAAIIFTLIVLIAVLWALFKLWFQLLFAFVFFLVDVIFAPFWILLGTLPGSPIGFGAWLRSMLSNLSPFPVTIAMFLLARIFMEKFQAAAGGTSFMPPLIGNPGAGAAGLAASVGLGFILLTPQVVTMIKDFFKAPVFKYFPAIGQAIGAGTGVLSAPFRPIVQAAGFLGGQQFLRKAPAIGKFFGGGAGQ